MLGQIIAKFSARCLSLRMFVLACLSASALVIAGPFGTYTIMPLPTRALYWVVICASAVLISNAVRSIVDEVYGPHNDWPKLVLNVILMTLVFTPVAYVTTLRFLNGLETSDPSFLMIGTFVGLITLLIQCCVTNYSVAIPINP